MALLAAVGNGNLTSSSTWALVDSTSLSNSESANSAVTTSVVASSTFTPGAITVDGVGIKLASRAASPTGTLTIELFNSTGSSSVASVTVNISDLPTCTATSGTTTPVSTAEGGWFFVKFAASHTLLGATAYSIRLSTSNATQVNVWSTATTNWSRYLRTTTTQAPVAGDDLIVTGEWTAAGTVTARTVTMDSTAATAYGSNTTTQVTPSLSICKSGTLSFGTTASTNYILQQKGYVVVYNGGTFNMGSSGSEIPRSSTAQLQFACGTAGDFGVVARNGGTVNMYGLSRTSGKNINQCKLNADASSGATSLTLDTDTGWLSGDLLCLAPTTQTASQFESKAATGNATATTIAVNALTNAHSGTSPTQAEVGLLTRNVQMIAVTTNVQTFLYAGNTATVALSWVDFHYLSTNSTGKRGMEITTTTGSFSMDSCDMRDSGSSCIYMTGSSFSGPSITNSIFYNSCVSNGTNAALTIASATSGTWTVNNCMFCGIATASTNTASLADVGGTLTNCSFSGGTGTGTLGTVVVNEGNVIGTFSGWAVHSNPAVGVLLNQNNISGTITSLNAWRNGTFGLRDTGNHTNNLALSLVTSNFFGNASGGIIFVGTINNLILDTCTFNGDTTFSQSDGLNAGSASANAGCIKAFNCSWSVVSGIKTKCTNDINIGSNAWFMIVQADDCIFNGTNIYAGASTALGPFLQAQNFGQTANDNRAYVGNGTTTAGLMQSDSGTVHGTDPLSQKMTPASASVKLQGTPFYIKANSGQTPTVGVYVQKNSSYTGNAPRLILLRSDSMGVTADTVAATFSAAANTWQQLTYTTGAAPQDGVYAFLVDCDGTAGAIFVGDWSQS